MSRPRGALALTLVLSTLLAAPVCAKKPKASLQAAISRMSAVQAMLEYFYMEGGVYPSSLSDLNKVFNYRVPPNAQAVNVPVDPASGQPFVYQVGPHARSYVLRLPDPSAYGVNFELRSVDWGWMSQLAEQRRFEQMALESTHNIKQLATEVELYANDHAGKYPKSLDALFPKYINRYPQDPLTGKNYVYVPKKGGYLIKCPNPAMYGLKTFQYSSSQGMEVERLVPKARRRPKRLSLPNR